MHNQSESSQQSDDNQSQQSQEESRRSAPSSLPLSQKSEKPQNDSDIADEDFIQKLQKNLQFGNEDLGIDLAGLQAQCPEALLNYVDKEDEPVDRQNPEAKLADKSSSDSDESSSDSDTDYEPNIMYEQQGVRVIQLTDIFFPHKEKQKEHLRSYNQKLMETVRERQDEEYRKRKRHLKEDYKDFCKAVQHKAKYLPVNPYLEDYYYLQNCNKNGVPSKRIQQQQQAYKSFSNPLLTQIQPQLGQHSVKRKTGRLQEAVIEQKIENDEMMIEACRVEELQTKFHSTQASNLKQTIDKRFPVPHFSLLQKQIYCHEKNLEEGTNLTPAQVTNHMMQEEMIERRYSLLRNDQGPIKRVKYWGELQDASSEQQLEKDKYICQRYQPKQQNLFKLSLQTDQSQARGLVENFKEYEFVQHKQKALFAPQKSQVTAKSIMRNIRHKLGVISDEEFYMQEMHHSNQSTAETPQQQFKQSIKTFQENLDVHFNEKRLIIQQEIIRRKERKEHANQQNQKPSTTTAYEPTSLPEPMLNLSKNQDQHNQEKSHTKIERNSDQSMSSSSDSDDDQNEWLDNAPKTGGQVLQSLGDELNHAKCIKDLSFYKLNWSEEDLENFHKPDIQVCMKPWQPVVSVPITNKKDDKDKRLNPQDYFKDRFKLSVQKGKFCLFEHIDQHPLFVNNFGMASRLKRFYYDDKQPNKRVFRQKQENIGTRHMGPHGKLVLKGKPQFVDPSKKELGLNPSMRLDLLGQIDTNQYQGITVLENKMYNAPVFYHNSNRTDFFCSLVLSKSNEQRIVIREMDGIYNVGQIEPKLEVVNPQSRYFQNLDKQRAKAYIIRFLQENKTIKFADIVDYFPQFREQILKNSLKESEIDIDRNGECKFTEKFDEERFKERMTPEMICQYESALHGKYRLEKLGITQILSADKITPSIGKFNREETDLTLRRIAKLIESEVLATPWNLSSSFIKVKQECSMMLLNGAGDPSFGHGGYSYIKMPLKISGDSVQGAKDNRMNLNPAIKNPKAVTRTDADLRKLQKKDIYEKLLNQGFTSEQLKDKTRWQMVGMLRQTAPNVEENKKYSRGVRYTSNKQREKYNQNANDKFAQQMKNLSQNDPSYVHNVSEDEPDFTQSDINRVSRSGQGLNACDFTEDIKNFTQEAIRKLSVETTEDQVREIKYIEDIPNYLSLLLLKLDRIPPMPGSQSQGFPQGNTSSTQITSEYLESLSYQQLDELKKILLDRISGGEISKKQNVICKMIRSLTDQRNQEGGDQLYTKVVFCAQERMIKKFERASRKNESVPKNKKSRQQGSKTQGLTAEQLQTGTGKSGDSVAQDSRSGVVEVGASVVSTIQKLKTLKPALSQKQKKPKVQPAMPIIKINYDATREQLQAQKTTISFKLQPDMVDQDEEEIEVRLSEGEDYEMVEDDDYGVEVPMSPEVVVRPKASKPKQPKLTKKPSTASRFKSHGFSKEDFDYQQPLSNNRSQRKRQQQCDQALNQIFGDILQEMWDEDAMQYFHNQVTKQDAPNYRAMVQRPICLKDMKNRAKRNEYKNREELLADIALMRGNTELFNGPAHYITQKAMELEQLANTQINGKLGEILNLETLVKENV